MAEIKFAHPFRITYPDGIPEDEVTHGVQFPDGRCLLALPYGGFHAAIDFDHLDLPDSAVVEWSPAAPSTPEGTQG
jgi:hypothetical protein